MKNLIFLLFTITLFTSCENEPYEAGELYEFGEQIDTIVPSRILADYSFYFNSLPNLLSDSDFYFTENINTTQYIEDSMSAFLTPSNIEITRNTNNNISEIKNYVNDDLKTTTEVFYTNSKIAQIRFTNLEDNTDNYIFNFEHFDNNVVKRTKAGTNENVTYTFLVSGGDRLFQTEFKEGDNEISFEIFTYGGGDGNISGSTKHINNQPTDFLSTVYVYDEKTNPLKEAFINDFRFLIFNNNDSSAFIGNTIAQFYSTNNWKGIREGNGLNPPEYNFTLQYDTYDRITNRVGNFSQYDNSISQSEIFNYID